MPRRRSLELLSRRIRNGAVVHELPGLETIRGELEADLPGLHARFAYLLAREPPLAAACARQLSKELAPAGLRARAELGLVLGGALNASGRFNEALVVCRNVVSDFRSLRQTERLAQTYCQQAVAHCYLGALDAAAASLARSKEYGSAERTLRAEYECTQGLIWRNRGAAANAIGCFERAQALWLEAGMELQALRCEREIGHTLSRGEPGRALAVLARVRTTFVAWHCSFEAAFCDLLSGHAAFEQDNYARAMQLLRRANVTFGKQALACFQAAFQVEAGLVKWHQTRLRQAQEHFQRAQDLYLALGIATEASTAEMNAGVVLMEQSRYEAAMSHLVSAEAHARACGQHRKVAYCLMNQGWARTRQARLADALQLYALARQEFEREQQQLAIARYCDLNEGLVYLLLGQWTRAREKLLTAHAVFTRENLTSDLAESEMYLAQSWFAEGNIKQAYEYLMRAWERFKVSGQPVYRARCERELGRAALYLQRPDSARVWLDAGERVFVRHQLPLDRALSRVIRGEMYLVRRQTARAVRCFQAALNVFGTAFPDHAWRAHYGLACAARAQGKPRRALELFRTAAVEIADLRGALASADWSNSFFGARQEVFRDALALAARVQDAGSALEVIEAAKARILLADLARRDWRRPNSAQEEFLLTQLEQVRAELSRLRDATAGGAAPTEKARLLAAEYEKVLERLLLTRRGLTGVPVLEPFDLARFRAAADARWGQWAALDYFLDGEMLYCVYLDPHQIELTARTLSARERFVLSQCANRNADVRERVYRGTVRGYSVADSSGALLAELAEGLLPRPILEGRGEGTLLISPHGILHQIPFQALRVGDRFLVERNTLVHAPVLEAWRRLNRAARVSKTPQLLLVGLSEFGERAAPLANAQVEVRELAALAGERARLLWQEQAQRATLLRWNREGILRRLERLHFATHALLDTETPHWSRILLADGELTTGDVLELDLDAQLVTLSACSSAMGRGGTGDDWVALTRAFFYAGARNVVGSLWQVEDNPFATELMRLFYNFLKRGDAVAEALRQAQLELIGEGAKPFHWAAYLAMGSG